MARVLVVGINPDTVDFSDPALPPGLNAEMIRRGMARAMQDLRNAGHEPLHVPVEPDVASLGPLAAALKTEKVDCVVVSGGVRLPPRNLPLFEAVLNLLLRAESRPAIALTTRPDDAAAGVARVLGR